jgi:ubiquinone/menaquinone biosynthesis C-methylase UbiE
MTKDEHFEVDIEFEITRPHGTGRLYNYLINYKFSNAVDKLPFDIKGLSVLEICCGSGMMTEYFARKEAKIVAIDISEECINRAKIRAQKYGFYADFKIGDSENLSYPDKSYDIVFVHDGLHHLRNPNKVIREMIRISKRAVIIIEPRDAFITKIAVLLGFSARYEGEDKVYLLKNKDIINIFKTKDINNFEITSYIMYYPHKPTGVFKFFNKQLLYQLFLLLFYSTNLFFNKLGNKVQIIGLK